MKLAIKKELSEGSINNLRQRNTADSDPDPYGTCVKKEADQLKLFGIEPSMAQSIAKQMCAALKKRETEEN